MMNVFVERRNGAVCGVYANLQPGFAEEELPEDHADVVEFRVRVNTPDPQTQIDTLERKAMLPRVVREDLLLRFVTAAAGQGISVAQLLDTQDSHYAPGFAKVHAFNEQIKALRAQL